MANTKTKVPTNSNKQPKKKMKKGVKALIWILSILALCSMAVVGHFVYKSCQPKPSYTVHDVRVYQPEVPEIAAQWIIEASTDNQDWKTGVFQAKSTDTIYVRARKKDSNSLLNNAPTNVYKICVIETLEGVKHEFSFEKDGEMYTGHFSMFERDIDIYIIAKENISQYIYTTIDSEDWVVETGEEVAKPIKLYKFSTIFEKEPEIKEYPRSGEGAFNMDVRIGNKVTEIPHSFLSYCKEFNSKITFDENSTCTTIGENFLNECSKFNTKIEFPDSLLYVGDGFLHECSSFNQPLNTNKVEHLFITTNDSGFLWGCSAFNSKLEIPNVKRIPQGFLYYCSSFDQTLEIPSSVTQIGPLLMHCCDNFCSNLDTKLVVNCSADAFYDKEDWATLSVEDINAPMYKNGINVDGSLAPKMEEMFPGLEGQGLVPSYRKWRK